MSKLNKRQANAFEVQAQFQTALALHQQGRLADAVRIYEEILQKAPDHFGALNLLGVIACQKRDHERAIQLISKAVSINPNIAAAHSNLGVALRELKRSKEALASFDKAIALKPDYAEAHHNRGLALKELGRLEEAIASYEKAIALKPDCEAFYHRGNALAEFTRFDEALASYDKAIAFNPNYADAHANRGNALKELGRFEEALASYDRVVALRRDSEDFFNRGLALHELNRAGEALASFDSTIALQPNYAEAHYNRGVALKEMGRLDDALASYDRAVTLKPDFAEAYSNRGNALKELSRPRDAIVSCDKAIALKPDFAEAYSNRGNALKELNRPEEALACYDKAIALKPDFAEAYSNRGIALKELNRPEEALASCDKAIALKPDFAAAHSNRGIALKELYRLEEALASCDKAVELKPNFAEAYSNRGNVLRELNRPEEAIADCDKAIALKPSLANAYSGRGSVLNEVGRLEEARAAYLNAIDIDPTSASAYFGLADSKKFSPGDPHLAAMQKLAAEGLSKIDRMTLDFALGKAYADVKNYSRSFQHLLAGNAAKRETISYDEQAAHAWFDRIETAFTRELIAAESGGGDPSTRPIFILGMPRSGTTLIEQILASHPKVYGAGELEVLNRIALEPRNARGLVMQYPNFVPSFDPADLTSLGARYLAAVERHAPQAERLTDKMPSNFLFVGLIHLALPNAKIIHTIRDPLDTCISCFSKLFTHGQQFSYDLGELGHYYKRYERLMAHWRRVLPGGRMLDVQYEDVVADLETQARRILAYCELPWDDRCLSFHETDRPVRTASMTQVRQPIYKSAVGRWHDYEEFLGPLLEALGIAPANADR